MKTRSRQIVKIRLPSKKPARRSSKKKPRASAPLSGEHATARGSTHERGARALSSTTRVPRAASTASTRTFESTQRRLPSQRLPVLFPELRRRRAPGRNMSRLVRALLGLPKPKGSDEREPDDDDPPYPDVTVVVIINKRSGSRLVRGRTASRPFDSRCFSTSDLHFELYSARPRRVIRS